MRKSISSQTIFTLLAVGVSMAALFVSMYQSAIMREQTELLIQQTKAQAWPHLDLELYRGFSWITEEGRTIDEFKITVQNKGTGPAIIEGLKISYNDTLVQNWEALFALMGVPDSIPLVLNNTRLHNRVIASNEEIRLIDFARNTELRKWVFKHSDKLNVQVCYRSVFDEYWTSERNGFQTNQEFTTKNQVEACTWDASALFVQ